MLNDKSKLPAAPSQLIRLAVSDLEKCERHGGYRIVFDKFCEPDNQDFCVSPAGAVMVQTLAAEYGIKHLPREFGPDRDRLLAIDFFAHGYRGAGLHLCGHKNRVRAPDRITPYQTNRAAFKRELLAVAGSLEAEGI